MSRVLVVDDEPDYREHLSLYLGAKGHEVRTASCGRDAIAVGLHYRPDVLVADWMLRNHIHGLHVCEVLRAAFPRLRTILITGFASRDLKSEAQRMRVLAFLEKPFDPERLDPWLADADRSAPLPRDSPSIGVFEIDAAGTIVHANARAREFFAETPAGRSARAVGDLFAEDPQADLSASTERWVSVHPRAQTSAVWHLRSRNCPDGEGRIVVLLHPDEFYRRNLPVVRMLLGLTDPVQLRWPLPVHVLILDDEEVVRRVMTAQLESVGCTCHAAEDAGTALRLVQRDADIGVVIMDYDMPGWDLADLIHQLRLARPGLALVGNSGRDRRDEFAAHGVNLFLSKPWRADNLINLLTGRIGYCVDCGLPLPLRRPRPDESAGSWVCRGCGSRYSAMVEQSSSAEELDNIRPAPAVPTNPHGPAR